MIFPVNYVIDEEQAIVVKTNAGSKLLWSQRSSVAFEIDEIDEKMKQGWSVVVRGRAEEVTPHDTDRYENAGMLDVQPWAEGDRSHLLRIVPNSVTGRELVPQD